MSVFSRGAYTMMWYEGFGADEALLIANHHTLTAGRHTNLRIRTAETGGAWCNRLDTRADVVLRQAPNGSSGSGFVCLASRPPLYQFALTAAMPISG